MNGKIILSVLIAFILVFGSLFLVYFSSFDSSSETYNYEIISDNLNPDFNTIFLLGSSHIGQLNSTLIIETVSKNNKNYEIYNLAVNGDVPKKRFDYTKDIISLNPSIVFYGISYRDFESTNTVSKNILPDLKLIFENSIPEELESINPQLITRRAMRDVLSNNEVISTNEYNIRPLNTPFFSLGTLETIILNETDLKRKLLTVLPPPGELYINSSNNQQVDIFKEMIQEFQDNQIKVVIFTTPIHELYLDEMLPESKITFNEILNEISNKHDVEIYQFTEKYAGLHVWNNLDHLAYNENSKEFSQDIAEMILMEIEK